MSSTEMVMEPTRRPLFSYGETLFFAIALPVLCGLALLAGAL